MRGSFSEKAFVETLVKFILFSDRIEVGPRGGQEVSGLVDGLGVLSANIDVKHLRGEHGLVEAQNGLPVLLAGGLLRHELIAVHDHFFFTLHDVLHLYLVGSQISLHKEGKQVFGVPDCRRIRRLKEGLGQLFQALTLTIHEF